MQHLGHKIKRKTSVLTRMALIPLVGFRRNHNIRQNAAEDYIKTFKYAKHNIYARNRPRISYQEQKFTNEFE